MTGMLLCALLARCVPSTMWSLRSGTRRATASLLGSSVWRYADASALTATLAQAVARPSDTTESGVARQGYTLVATTMWPGGVARLAALALATWRAYSALLPSLLSHFCRGRTDPPPAVVFGSTLAIFAAAGQGVALRHMSSHATPTSPAH